jgi:hypothetical protein
MPSTSKKQHNFMEAVAHNPAFAKKAGVPMSVGKDFSAADKGRKFSKGGSMAKSDMKEDMKMDTAQDKAMIKKAFKQHDAQEHKGGKGTTLKLAKGGSAKFMSFSEDGKPAGMKSVKKMASGGTFRSSANGIAQRGKTKGTQIAMCGGGMMKGKK